MGVIQERKDRVAEESEAAWHEAFMCARWLSKRNWEEEFGPSMRHYWNGYSKEVYNEADRLINGE